MLCALYCELQTWDRMQAAAERCEQLGRELGNAQFLGSARGWRAWLQLQLGHTELAYQVMGEAVTLLPGEATASRASPHDAVGCLCADRAAARRPLRPLSAS